MGRVITGLEFHDRLPVMDLVSRWTRACGRACLLGCLATLTFACRSPLPGDGAAGDGGADASRSLPTGKELLAAHAAACGGVAAAASIRSLKIDSRIEIRGQAIRADAEYQWREDGRFLQVQRIEGVGEVVSGFDGVDVWSQDPIYGDRVLSGEERAQALWLASPVSWARYAEYVAEANTTGRRTAAGRTSYEVELKINGGATATARVDAQTKRLTALSMEVISPSGAQPVTVAFEDYRAVAGYEMAHVQVVTSATGIIREEYRVVVANAPLQDGVFARRKSAEVKQVAKRDLDGDGLADRSGEQASPDAASRPRPPAEPAVASPDAARVGREE